MPDNVHIRVETEMKKEMKELVDESIFKNQGEIVREGIRKVLQKWLT